MAQSDFDYDACPVDQKGHRWAVTRGGERVRLLCKDAPREFCIVGVWSDAAIYCWRLDGTHPNLPCKLLTPKLEPFVTWQNWYERDGRIEVWVYATQELADAGMSHPFAGRIGGKAHRVEVAR